MDLTAKLANSACTIMGGKEQHRRAGRTRMPLEPNKGAAGRPCSTPPLTGLFSRLGGPGVRTQQPWSLQCSYALDERGLRYPRDNRGTVLVYKTSLLLETDWSWRCHRPMLVFDMQS